MNAYVLRIELKRFYVREWEQNPEEPLIVVRDKFVLDANEAACARGVCVGQPVKQAKAILHGGQFKRWEADLFVARSRSWLDLCVDYSNVLEPDDQHSAWIDLSAHPEKTAIAERLIRRLSSETKLTVRSGAAPSKWLAKLAAWHDDCGLALRDPQEFLAPLHVSELLPIQEEHRQRLQFLGYKTIGEVMRIPPRVLQEQFGQEGLRIRSAAFGSLGDPVRPLYPPLSVADQIVFNGPLDSSEALKLACQTLAGRLGERLVSGAWQGVRLQVALESEVGIERRARTFAKPIACSRTAFSALQLLLMPAPKCSIVAMRVLILDLKRVRQVQRSLIEIDPQRDRVRMESALGQVRTLFGEQSVQLGAEIRLPRRVKVLREWRHATGWR